MTPQKAARVAAEHIVNGRVCSDYTITAAEKNSCIARKQILRNRGVYDADIQSMF